MRGQCAQGGDALLQQGKQARAFALAGGHQFIQRLAGQGQQGFAQGRAGGAVASGQAQGVGDREGGGFGQPHAHLLLRGGQALEGAHGHIGQGAASGGFHADAQFHLAALEALGDQLAQCGFLRAQFVGQAQHHIQKAAIDRAQLQRQAGGGRGYFGVAARGVLGAGVTRHTVNWHVKSFLMQRGGSRAA